MSSMPPSELRYSSGPPSDELRAVAGLIRQGSGPFGFPSDTVAHAVADWLDSEAASYDFAWNELGETPSLNRYAIAVARAFLGEGE